MGKATYYNSSLESTIVQGIVLCTNIAGVKGSEKVNETAGD